MSGRSHHVSRYCRFVSVSICGVLVASLKSGLLTDSLENLAKRKAETLAAEIVPQLQIDMIVSQLKSMCPVSYGENVTLIDVNATSDLEITARYVLTGTNVRRMTERREELRELAIQQFRSTGLSEKVVAGKIHWRYTYETVGGEQLMEIDVTPATLSILEKQRTSLVLHL